MDYYRIDIPARERPGDLKYITRIIEASRDTIHEVLPEARFVVVLYPDQPDKSSTGETLIPFLEDANLEYCDYTELFTETADYWLQYDGHPTARAHAEFGERLLQDIVGHQE